MGAFSIPIHALDFFSSFLSFPPVSCARLGLVYLIKRASWREYRLLPFFFLRAQRPGAFFSPPLYSTRTLGRWLKMQTKCKKTKLVHVRSSSSSSSFSTFPASSPRSVTAAACCCGFGCFCCFCCFCGIFFSGFVADGSGAISWFGFFRTLAGFFASARLFIVYRVVW
ncbi:hypothetical protein DFH27DRAFT_542118 [Peziza echinospora]|nr:hypothetical protein DFH27DRAFT_542118 [Peziza echinospora]